jgi:thiamine-phosphate pyrophosphorylase
LCASGKRTFPNKRPLFYYITDRRGLAGGSLLRSVRRALLWGVDFVQIREKDLSDRALFELTRKIVDYARSTHCRIIVNGRADIAVAAGAHGVHLPSTGFLVSDIRPWLPEDFLVGVSTHSRREAVRAAEAGADYVLFGPLFPTESKLRYGAPLGLPSLRPSCRSLRIPVLGLGGIHPEQVPLVLEAGAAGVAGISLFQNDSHFRRLR